jgi:DNA primase
MNGVQNIVAPQGTAFTEQHARIIKRYCNEVVLCFDSDNAGQNAIVRSLDHLLASGLAVRVAVVPSPHDPDSFIKANGGAAFSNLIKNAAGFFDYYLNRLCATNEINSDKGRLVILKSMAESVHKTGNSVLIDTYAQKTALRLGVPPESVRAEFKKNPAPHVAPRANEEESFESAGLEAEIAPPSPIELHLLKLLLQHDGLIANAALNLDVNWILHPHVRQIVDLRFAAHEHATWHSLAEFLDSCESAEQRNLITEAVTEDRKIPNPETQLADVTRTLKNQFLEREIQILTHAMSQPNIGKEELEQITRKQQELKFELKAIALTSIRSRNSK